jgi:hypothetical protein
MSGMKWVVEKVNISTKTGLYGLCVLAHENVTCEGDENGGTQSLRNN